MISRALLVWIAAVTTVRSAFAQQQRATPALLEGRNVPRPDTTVALTVGTRELLAELRVPAGPGPHPVAVVIHGGCWVTKFADNRYMRPLAEALRQAGIATFNISYRRADEAGGAWPGTFLDVAAEAALLPSLAKRYSLDLDRVVATGHSAGAHLSLWLASRPKLPVESAIRSSAAVPAIRGVVALDGPGDLVASNEPITGICGGPVLEQLMAGSPAAHPDRWHDASPSSFLPLGVPQAMVRGGMDAGMVQRGFAKGAMTDYASRARAAGDSVWIVTADTTSHFAMLDPEGPAFAVVLQAMRNALAMRSSDESAIRTARDASNRAIAAHDLAAVAAVWLPEYHSVASTNAQANGRNAARANFAQYFKTRPDVVYRREPTTITVNASWGQSGESGRWNGSWTQPDGVTRVGGIYFAKWKKVGEHWLLLSETFVQTSCSGTKYCDASP